MHGHTYIKKAVQFVTNCLYEGGGGVHAILTTNSSVLCDVTAMCVRTIVKRDYQLLHACPSVRPRGTTQLRLDGF